MISEFRTLLTGLVFTLAAGGCDTALIVRGVTLEGTGNSHTLRSPGTIDSTKRIGNADFTLYPQFRDSQIPPGGNAATFRGDSVGNFAFTRNVGPGSHRAALISRKEGFLPDTLIFEYEPLRPESLIVILKRTK